MKRDRMTLLTDLPRSTRRAVEFAAKAYLNGIKWDTIAALGRGKGIWRRQSGRSARSLADEYPLAWKTALDSLRISILARLEVKTLRKQERLLDHPDPRIAESAGHSILSFIGRSKIAETGFPVRPAQPKDLEVIVTDERCSHDESPADPTQEDLPPPSGPDESVPQ